MTYNILRRFFVLYQLDLVSRETLVEAIKHWQHHSKTFY